MATTEVHEGCVEEWDNELSWQEHHGETPERKAKAKELFDALTVALGDWMRDETYTAELTIDPAVLAEIERFTGVNRY